MGITVKHEMDGGVVGDAAFASGYGQGVERRREQDRKFDLETALVAIRRQAQADANNRFRAQLDAQTTARDDELDFRKLQYEQLPERQAQRGVLQNELQKDMSEWQYSRGQQQELSKIAQARDYVTRNADGRYTPEEQQNLLTQIDEMEYGIQPLERRQQSPWPKEQDTGSVWADESTGATMTRDDKGNVKVLVQPQNLNSFDNQLKLKEKISAHAKDIYDTQQMSETPLSWDEAVKQAESFYSDLMPPKPDPIINPQPQGIDQQTADSVISGVQQAQVNWQQTLKKLEDENAGRAPNKAMEKAGFEFIANAQATGLSYNQARKMFFKLWQEKWDARGLFWDDVVPNPDKFNQDRIPQEDITKLSDQQLINRIRADEQR